jgi:hypothetical protein
MFNPYLYEKLAQSHHQELLQEVEQQRMLSQLPRRHPQLLQNVTRRLAAFLLNLNIEKVRAFNDIGYWSTLKPRSIQKYHFCTEQIPSRCLQVTWQCTATFGLY